MKRTLAALTAALAAALALLGAATAQAATCAPLAWSEAKTAAPAPADIALLDCWSKAGNPDAAYMLAMLTKAGRGMTADPVAARAALTVLARGSDADAVTGALSSRGFGYQLNGNDSQGTRAVDVPPYAPAQRELAKMLLLGQGGDKDVPAAKAWLKKAKDKDKEAAILLAALEAKGF